METATAGLVHRPIEPVTPISSTAPPEGHKALAVTAAYLLSEDGRKASLLGGGDGRARQDITLQVPANRLHLVSVDATGVARLKLRPQYRLDAEQKIIRTDALPTYDAPPSIEELYREAARNHQLERTYEAERQASRDKRREADRERRTTLATAFLNDPTQRALAHPAPTATRCYLNTPTGRLLFDSRADAGPAQELPAEAHRRFRADLRTRRERNLQTRATQLALHDEKKRFIEAWIVEHGTPDQQTRQTAGVLPIEEAIESMTDHVFAALASRAPYVPDGLERLQEHIRGIQGLAHGTVARADLLVTTTNVERMTATQWQTVMEFRALMPDATVTMRKHQIAWKGDRTLALDPTFGVVVTQKFESFTLRREYAV